MNFLKSAFILLMTVFILMACSSEPLTEQKYQEFKETISQEDFTGFAYILSDYKAQDNNYLTHIQKAFESEGKNLIYFNDQQTTDKVHESFNKDSQRKDLYLPIDEIAFIEDGKLVKEFEVTEEILSKETQEKLKSFIQKQSE